MVTSVMKPSRNIETHRSDIDLLEHVGAGGVVVVRDLVVHRPDEHIVVVDPIASAIKKLAPHDLKRLRRTES
jgi:hypothetical protein